MTLGEKITKEKIPGLRVFENFDMTNRSTLKTKSVAKLFLELGSLESLKVLKILESEGKTSFPLGKGSNTLFPEKIESVPFSLKGDFCKAEVTNSQIFCGAGATLSSVFKKAYNHGLTGFESLALIPGTVGGALKMNAGCFGREISHTLDSVIVQTLEGGISLKKSNLDESDPLTFSYRNCEFFHDKLALFAAFSLKTCEQCEILQSFQSFKERKNSSQPTHLPSLGSVFKRKGDFLPAKAIDRLGLKGERVGNMAVSEKHSGFIVNLGNGTAKEFLKLVEKIEDIVYNIDKVILEREFEILT